MKALNYALSTGNLSFTVVTATKQNNTSVVFPSFSSVVGNDAAV